MTDDAVISEYCQAREDLRHKYNNYRYIIITMVTGGAALASLLLKDGLEKIAVVVPGFLLIWLIFLGYNFHQIANLKACIELLEGKIKNLAEHPPCYEEIDAVGGAYPWVMGFSLGTVFAILYVLLTIRGVMSISDEGMPLMVIYCGGLGGLPILMGFTLLLDFGIFKALKSKK